MQFAFTVHVAIFTFYAAVFVALLNAKLTTFAVVDKNEKEEKSLIYKLWKSNNNFLHLSKVVTWIGPGLTSKI